MKDSGLADVLLGGEGLTVRPLFSSKYLGDLTFLSLTSRKGNSDGGFFKKLLQGAHFWLESGKWFRYTLRIRAESSFGFYCYRKS